MLMSLFLKHNFASMGKIQMKTLFLGMMHFQDEYTYDIHRVEKCDIHYAMPDGEVLPFCTFNVFPEVYRDKAQKQYSIPSTEWEKTHPGWTYPKDKYMRNVKELEATELYMKTYGNMMDYFALPVNGGKPVKNFSNPAPPRNSPPKPRRQSAGARQRPPQGTRQKCKNTRRRAAAPRNRWEELRLQQRIVRLRRRGGEGGCQTPAAVAEGLIKVVHSMDHN